MWNFRHQDLICVVWGRECALTTMSLKLSVLELLLSELWISSLWRLIPPTFTSWTRLEKHSNHGNTHNLHLNWIIDSATLHYLKYASKCVIKVEFVLETQVKSDQNLHYYNTCNRSLTVRGQDVFSAAAGRCSVLFLVLSMYKIRQSAEIRERAIKRK